MFGFVRFEEFYAAYSFIGYGSIATGLVNLFFGGLETLLLGSISVSIFSIIVAVKHENREKIDKYLKWIKKLLIFLWFFILIMFALTVTSAWLLDDAYRAIRKFNSSVEYNASWLLVSAGIYGFIAFTVQDIFINMVANLENTVNGKPSERDGFGADKGEHPGQPLLSLGKRQCLHALHIPRNLPLRRGGKRRIPRPYAETGRSDGLEPYGRRA